jgi:glycosyltransferase involved in cell wall biosynthesis
MMHICFICNEYPLKGIIHGGIGTVVKLLATEYAKRNIRVSVVGFYPFDEDVRVIEDNVHIYALRKSRFPFLRFIDNSRRVSDEIKRIHKSVPIDVLETQENGFAFIRPIPKVKFGIRLNGGHHFFADSEKRKIDFWKGWQEKQSFKRSDFFIPVSEYVRDHTLHYIHFDKQKTKVIFNITDTSTFRAIDNTSTIPGRILFVGSIKEKKGVIQLVEAFPAVKALFPQATLILAGRGDFAFMEGLKTRVTSEVLKDIHFLGPVQHSAIPELLATAEVCVYPSHMEALPLAWLEALASGKPFVGSKAGPGPEVVKDGVTGLLCDPYSSVDIANKIIYFFSNPAMAKQMGSQARADVLDRFSVERVIEENVEFYKNIVK